MRVEFHPEAELETHRGSGLLRPSSSRTRAERFESEVTRAIDLLRDQPNIGRPLDENLRALVLRRFPFTLIYFAAADFIRIEAVAHQHRLPGYWRGRIDR